MQVKLYSELSTEVLQRRDAKQYDAQSLMLAGKLLEQNPELYTVWNFRREALETVLDVSRPGALTCSPASLCLQPACVSC